MDTVNMPAKFEVRSFTRSWDSMAYSKNWGSPWICPRFIISQNFKGLLFGRTLWIYLPYLKFVALSLPEIIGGTQKIWGVPGFVHSPYSPKFLKGFCSHWPCEVNIPAKFEVRSFTRSWDNMGYSKTFGQSLYMPMVHFLPNFLSAFVRWTMWIYLPNLTFVALAIPEIIGGTSKIRGVSGFVHPPYSPKFLKGFCLHGPCEYTCQV